MAHPFTLPLLGGALLTATALGVHLGNSAVSLIHPVHFQGAAVHPRDRGAAIDPNRVRPSQPAYGELYGWDEGYAARAADCGDCGALAARDAYAYSAAVPYFGGRDTNWAPAPAPAAEPEPAVLVVEDEAVAARKDHVERYAHYPVTEDEATAEADAEGGEAPAYYE